MDDSTALVSLATLKVPLSAVFAGLLCLTMIRAVHGLL
jgi:hypothetical protein